MRCLPKQEERVETGAVQFGDDWSGIFIRGDECAHYSKVLEILLESYGVVLSPLICSEIRKLKEFLNSSTSCLGSGGEEGISKGES